ncbi:MAG TPA: SIS domain-containing protein [Candidatus Limnocylindrales bacterium]|jgi:glucosamine--fructose-6-phosphate aminotransferase (isomerizing)|nr:SIS domain-containing protein [Candidatus Limnocylindrales bacterium]
MSLAGEIAEQPAVAERFLGERRDAVARIADRLAPRIAAGELDFVMIAARGTSDHAAIYAQYVFGAHLRLPIALAAPSLISLYGVEPRVERALVIGISQSGRSPDIVDSIAAARRQGAPTIAITNEPDSELAAAAEDVIDLGAGPELAVAATKTYTSQLLAVATLVSALEARITEGAARGGALEAVPDALRAALKSEPQAEAVARHLASRDRVIVVGRGFEYATAREFALKLKELARVSADPYSTADFLHGPLALVEPGFPVIAVAPSGAAAADIDTLLVRLGELGVDRIVLTDRPKAIAAATLGIVLPSGLPEWLMPIAAIVPAQLVAMHLAVARGIDPEAPRWIRKVTLTR